MKVASYKNFNKNFFLNSVVNDFASAIFPNKLKLSGPLDFPSEKSFLLFYYFNLFFAHEKGLGHMFQK